MLLAGHSVNDGFSLSCRIIQVSFSCTCNHSRLHSLSTVYDLQDFRLPALNIYKQVAETLASDQKFAEIQVLLSNAIQTRVMNDKDHDSVVLTMLGILTDDDKKVEVPWMFFVIFSNIYYITLQMRNVDEILSCSMF